MTTKKISELTALSNVETGDFVPVLDSSAVETKKASLTDIVAGCNNIIATVSGSTFTQLSGSLQKTAAGLSYLVGAGSISVVSQSSGQIIISGSVPIDASYLSLGGNSSLTAERTFTPGTGLFGTDAGANSTYTLAIDDDIVATISGSKFSGPVTASLGVSASFFQLGDIGGQTMPQAGLIRLPYAGTNAIGLIRGVDSGGTERNIMQWGLGDSITLGPISRTHDMTIYGLTLNPNATTITFNAGAGGWHVADFNSNSFIKAIAGTGGTDAQVWFSGSIARADGNSERKVVVFGGDVVFSGSIQQKGQSNFTTAEFDSVFKVHNLKGRVSSTNSVATTVVSFLSGVNGRSYGVDAYLTCQHTSTIECGRWKLSGHFYRSGGSMVLVCADTAVSSSNVTALSGTLTTSGGNIIVQGVGTSTGSFYWGCDLRVQELGT